MDFFVDARHLFYIFLNRRNKANRDFRHERGFTLLELTMSLAIIAVLVGGIVLFFSSASASQKTSDAMYELGDIQQAVHSMYSGQADYSSLGANGAQIISQSQQIPAKWGGGSGSLTDPFGGAVSITAEGNAIAGGPGPNGAFIVEMDSIPTSACVKMVTQDLGPSMLGVGVNSSPAGITGPISPVTAQGSCGGGAASNKIFWVFY